MINDQTAPMFAAPPACGLRRLVQLAADQSAAAPTASATTPRHPDAPSGRHVSQTYVPDGTAVRFDARLCDGTWRCHSHREERRGPADTLSRSPREDRLGG